MKLVIEPSGDYLRPWAVRGEGCNFHCSCETIQDARAVAHVTKRDFAPRAEIVDFPSEYVDAEERAMRRDWKDVMRSDWNE